MLLKIFSLFKPAHIPSQIKDENKVNEAYKYWRIRIFYSIYVGYVFYYFTRKSMAFITPFLSSDLGFSKSDIGLLGSILSLSYGLSKFVSGILSDRSNPRYFMAIGLIATGICNIIFGWCSSLFVLGLICGVNGLFQGWGWPACTKQLTHWFGSKERGTWWSLASTSNNLGGFLIAYLVAHCAHSFGWRYGMFAPGVLCILVGIWLLNRLRDVPESLGLPPVEQWQGEPKKTKRNRHILPIRKILFEQVLSNKYLWWLSVSYFCIYVVRTAINDFGTLYLVQTKGYSPVSAATCVSLFEVGGFIGMLITGWGSDRWFAGRRAPIIIMCAFGLIFATLLFGYVQSTDFVTVSFLIFIVGVLVFGPQMLIGLAAAELADKNASSTANGFVGAWGYLGAAFAGYPLGRITEIWDWSGFILTLSICSGIVVIILLPLWSLVKRD